MLPRIFNFTGDKRNYRTPLQFWLVTGGDLDTVYCRWTILGIPKAMESRELNSMQTLTTEV